MKEVRKLLSHRSWEVESSVVSNLGLGSPWADRDTMQALAPRTAPCVVGVKASTRKPEWLPCPSPQHPPHYPPKHGHEHIHKFEHTNSQH